MPLIRRSLLSLAALAVSVTLAGCGLGPSSTGPTSSGTVAAALHGSVHGGQQPVAGATLQLYAAGTTGYGSASRALIASTVKTDSGGNFSITGMYACQPGDLVYLVATGGNPGVSGTANNSALAEMAALGPCSALTPLTNINVNELTTVASVWSLAPFMTAIGNVGTTSTNTAGLVNAFRSVNVVSSIAGGSLPGPSLPAGATLPIAEIDTLADILASCINTVDSVAPAAQSSSCSAVFAASATAASTPTNTIQAALNLAHNPTLGLGALNGMVTPSAPFQPILSAAPGSWTIAINYTGAGLNQPAAIATDPSGNVWVTNPANNSVSEFAAGTAAPLSPAAGYTAGPLSTPTGLAIDNAGNAWISNRAANSITKLSSSGSALATYTGGGLNQPNTLAIDAAGNVWAGNAANDSVSELNSAGTPVSPAAGFPYTGNQASTPTAIAINPK